MRKPLSSPVRLTLISLVTAAVVIGVAYWFVFLHGNQAPSIPILQNGKYIGYKTPDGQIHHVAAWSAPRPKS